MQITTTKHEHTCRNPDSGPNSISNFEFPITNLVLPDLYITILPNNPSLISCNVHLLSVYNKRTKKKNILI